MGKHLEQTLAVLTGTVGDYLARTGNGLATPMTLAHRGAPLAVTRPALTAAFPLASSHAVLLIHGLMATEHCFALADRPDGEEPLDYGTLLHEAHGWTPLRLRFNTGVPIAQSGRHLADLLAQLVDGWPVPLVELAVVCHSMGGLVFRAACDAAAATDPAWLRRVGRAVYLGTPHQGAPLERAGRLATRLFRGLPDPVAQLVGQVADLRSRGIQELGDPTDTEFPSMMHHLLVAGTLAHPTLLQTWLGDGMVSVDSAHAGLEGATLPKHVTLRQLSGVSHAGLAYNDQVAEILVEWLAPHAESPVVAAASADAATPPPASSSAAAARLHGLFDLTQAALLQGNRAVERVRLRRGDQIFAVLQAVPGLGAPARLAQAVHDVVVVGSHGAVEAVTQTAGALHERGFRKKPTID